MQDLSSRCCHLIRVISGSSSLGSTLETLVAGFVPSLALVTGALDSASAALYTLPGLCSNMIFGKYGDNLKYYRARRPLV